MKFIRVFFTVVATLLLTVIIALESSGNAHLLKGISNTYFVGHTGPTIDDYPIFESRLVETSEEIPLKFDDKYGALKVDQALMGKIEEFDPAALLVLKDGAILYEKYWDSYNNTSMTNSFSVAKSIVGLSIGKCLDLHLLKSLDQKVIDIIPELKGTYRETITLRHLMNMTSGINFDESYGNPFGFMAKAYYGESLLETTLEYTAETEPGTVWKYSGGNTILLSVIVKRVTGQHLSDFVSAHFWKPLGASQPALWNLDKKDGIEKAYCCFYSNAADFARFGQLILDSGMVDGKEVISRNFINEIKKDQVLKDGSPVPKYGMHFWKTDYKSDIVYARGILGQFIISIPDLNMVVVRLGHRRGDKDEFDHPSDVYLYIDLAYQLVHQ
ncbi:MAG TPA: serine hydrolase [Flavobacteriales bacterium]|nr:serine hydrolase [Flavobacteriales bacterium]